MNPDFAPRAPLSPLTEEEALAVLECATKSLLRLSAAGFLAKYKRGELSRVQDPTISEIVKLIPARLRRQAEV